MELFRLNATHMPGPSIEFRPTDSLVWTERYQSSGDFKLVVEDNINILTALPRGSLISHTDTTEVMIVENHEIQRDAEKKLTITLSGRGFETFAENRITAGSETPLNDSVTQAANVETFTSWSAGILAMYLLQMRLDPDTASVDEQIPNLSIYTALRVLDPEMDYVIKRGDIYSRVLELLKVGDAGLKTMRPNGAQTTMDLVVHDGEDLRNLVVFYAQYEDLDDAHYFWSIQGYKNYAFAEGKYSGRLIRSRDVATNQTGLNRRVMYVEASDLEGDYTPGSVTDILESRAQTALHNQQELALMQATISMSARPKFKITYDVGDLVTVFGEFGVAQAMRVTEHILAIDKDGMRGYPSLTIV